MKLPNGYEHVATWTHSLKSRKNKCLPTIPITNTTEWPKRLLSLSLVFLPPHELMLTIQSAINCCKTPRTYVLLCNLTIHGTIELVGSCAGEAAAPTIAGDRIHITITRPTPTSNDRSIHPEIKPLSQKPGYHSHNRSCNERQRIVTILAHA